VREQVFTAAVRRDETKTFCIVEPLNSASRHFNSPKVILIALLGLVGEEKG
jgi:hypothetical protein